MKKTKEKKIKVKSEKNNIKEEKLKKIKAIFPNFNQEQIEFLYKLTKK